MASNVEVTKKVWNQMSKDTILDREATVNGIRIHYKIAGSGSPLLLLHGSPLTSRSWLRIMPELTKTHTVVAPDLRGYGQSEKPEHGYEVQTMVEDLKQLLDQLGVKSVDIVGHDLGGIVAYVYAAKRSDQVSRLGIIEAPMVGVASPTMQGVLASYWHIGFYAHPRLPELLITGRERDYLAEFIRTYQYKRDAFSKEDLEIAAEAPDLIQLTNARLTMPVWAVGGDHSMGAGPLEQFQHLAQSVKGGVINDCGHWIIEEQPAKLLENLGQFLRE